MQCKNFSLFSLKLTYKSLVQMRVKIHHYLQQWISIEPSYEERNWTEWILSSMILLWGVWNMLLPQDWTIQVTVLYACNQSIQELFYIFQKMLSKNVLIIKDCLWSNIIKVITRNRNKFLLFLMILNAWQQRSTNWWNFSVGLSPPLIT